MSTQTLRAISQKMFLIFPLVVTSMGTIGNLLSIGIFCSNRFGNKEFVFYNMYILVFELLIYYLGSLKYFIQAAFTSPMNASLFMCKLLNYVIRPLEETTAWVHMLMTLDRYLATHYPGRFKVFETRWFQVLMVSIVTIAFFVFNLPIWIYHELAFAFDPFSNNFSVICIFPDQHKTAFMVVDIGLILLLCVSPFIVMLYMSISISMALLRSKKRLNRYSNRFSRKEYQFALTTIGQNFLFLVFIFPISLFMPFFSMLRAGTITIEPSYGPVVELVNATVSTLIYFYYSISFFINLAFNWLFRDIFLSYLGIRSKRINGSS